LNTVSLADLNKRLCR